jgi:hypothetical protein
MEDPTVAEVQEKATDLGYMWSTGWEADLPCPGTKDRSVPDRRIPLSTILPILSTNALVLTELISSRSQLDTSQKRGCGK